jgi:hypothetical protein
MNIDNLLFFDRNGESYNFSQTATGVWEGADYFMPISLALYDVSNLFILEKVGSEYKFPVLESGARLEVRWKTQESADSLFLFTISRDVTDSEAPSYITRQTAITINRSDFDGVGDLNLSYPLQLNVGFSPLNEIAYARTLEIYYIVGSTETKLASIYFYGEGEDEDERFRVWLQNFGIKFNREDALLLKNYDLKEGLPDWKQINQARKEILVNRDQIYPYVGTYKGLMNLINILGYRDVLRVKEYWRDRDPNSNYYNKFAMVDITDLMNVGTIDDLNLIDLNGQIKKSGKFKKTEFLALVYEFSVASDTYDSDGLPEVEFTTEFEVNEIFYKLNRLADKLKAEILPVNVKIRDIIGEFIYFEKLTIRIWQDSTIISSIEVNDTYSLRLRVPSTTSHFIQMRDIKPLYPKIVLPDSSLSEFPEVTFNDTVTDPYQNGQKYDLDQVPGLIQAMSDYYDQLKTYEFTYHGQVNPLMAEDDTTDRVGCPVCLEAYLPDLMLMEFGGSKFEDYDDTYYTIGNIKYKSGYEIEWNISGPLGYKFTWRSQVPDLVKLPHFLPHSGNYEISATIYNLQGAASQSKLSITVEANEPSIEVFTKIQDKVRYQFGDLRNVTIGDMQYSKLYLPYANVLQNGESASTLPKHYIDWYTYINGFGIGQPMNSAEIFTEGIGFEPISTTTNDVALLWGTGNGNGQPTLRDYGFATIGELTFNRMIDLSYVSNKINGFYINLVDNPNDIVAINFLDSTTLTDITISSYSDAQDLADQLNSLTDIHVSEYRYSVINGNIHAQSIRQDRTLNRIISTLDATSIRRRIYTFCEPYEVYSTGLLDSINLQLQTVKVELDKDLIFLDANFTDCLRKIGERCYSATSATVPAVPSSVIIELNKPTTISIPSNTELRLTSISNPSVWMQGPSLTQITDMQISFNVTSYSGSLSTAADWKFDYVAVLPDYPISYAPAGAMSYWVNRGCIEYDTNWPTPQEYRINGHLPSNYDENTFTLSNLKIGLGALTVPLFQPVFAVVSNVDSKKQIVWTLKNGEVEVVKIRSNSYFVWRFDSPGDYLLTAEVMDTRGNVYKMNTEFNASSAMDIKKYKQHVELSLNRRKDPKLPNLLEY